MRRSRHKSAGAGLAICCAILALESGCSADPHLEKLAGRWRGQNSKAVFDLDAEGRGTLYRLGGIPGVINGTCEKDPCVNGTCVTIESSYGPVKQCQLPCISSDSCAAGYVCAKHSKGYACLSDDGFFPAITIEADVDSFNAYRVNFGPVESAVGKPGSPILVGCRLDGDNLSCAEPGLFGDSFIPDNEFVRQTAADGG